MKFDNHRICDRCNQMSLTVISYIITIDKPQYFPDITIWVTKTTFMGKWLYRKMYERRTVYDTEKLGQFEFGSKIQPALNEVTMTHCLYSELCFIGMS